MMINNKPNLLRMDSLKRYDAYDIHTNMVMVSSNHLDAMRKAAKEGATATVKSTDLEAATWQQLRNDVMAEQWPLDEKERQAMFVKLREEHQGSADRLGFLISAFKDADPKAEAFLAAESKDN